MKIALRCLEFISNLRICTQIKYFIIFAIRLEPFRSHFIIAYRCFLIRFIIQLIIIQLVIIQLIIIQLIIIPFQFLILHYFNRN
jgi:hypothetical protein